MPGHLGSIGFLFESDAEYADVIERLANEATERLAVAAGDYAIWRSRTGAEVWFHVIGDRQPDGELANGGIIGFQSFFEGDHIGYVRLEGAAQLDEENPFAGLLIGQVVTAPQDGRTAYPIVFDAVDFAAHAAREFPVTCTVKLTGVARVISTYACESEFANAGSETAGLASRSFVPVGLTAMARDPISRAAKVPSAHALINGEVLEHTTFRNEESGLDFRLITVSSDRGTYEILAEPILVPSDLTPGCFASVMCWMVGRVVEDR